MIYADNNPKVIADPNNFFFLSSFNGLVIYAHGDIQDKLGFDMIVTDSINTINKIMRTKVSDIKAEVQAMDSEGNIFDAIIIAWYTKRDPVYAIRGYMLDRRDAESIDYALKKQLEKASIQ